MTSKEIESLLPTDRSTNGWLRMIALMLARQNEAILKPPAPPPRGR